MYNYCTIKNLEFFEEKPQTFVCPITNKDTTINGISVQLDQYHKPIRVCSQDCVKKVKNLYNVFMYKK